MEQLIAFAAGTFKEGKESYKRLKVEPGHIVWPGVTLKKSLLACKFVAINAVFMRALLLFTLPVEGNSG